MTIQEIVIKEMNLKGWNNAELARKTGLSPTYIGQIVNDRKPTKAGKPVRWTIDTLSKLSKALGVKLDVLKDAAGLKFDSLMAQCEKFADVKEWTFENRRKLLSLLSVTVRTDGTLRWHLEFGIIENGSGEQGESNGHNTRMLWAKLQQLG